MDLAERLLNSAHSKVRMRKLSYHGSRYPLVGAVDTSSERLSNSVALDPSLRECLRVFDIVL